MNKWLSQLVAIFSIILFGLFFHEMQIIHVSAQGNAPDVNIYMFWGEGCPHCEVAKPVYQGLAESDPRINFYGFEVYHHPENLDLFREFAALHGGEPQGVPTVYVGDRYWVGYSENIKNALESYLKYCLAGGCSDPGTVIPSAEMIQEIDQQNLSYDLEENSGENKIPRFPIVGGLIDSSNSLVKIILWVIGGSIGIGVIAAVVSRSVKPGTKKKESRKRHKK